jgi:hypothetical protein
MNSLKHGLTAKSLSLAERSQDAFYRLAQSHLDKWKPVNEHENEIVEKMIVTKWLQRRNWAVQTATLDDETEVTTMRLLRRYDSRLNCQFHRAMDQLIKIRASTDPLFYETNQ